jgi:hypothetical protein
MLAIKQFDGRSVLHHAAALARLIQGKKEVLRSKFCKEHSAKKFCKNACRHFTVAVYVYS